jgi:hypothetical protein
MLPRILLCLAVAACAKPPEMGWIRHDGTPITDAQFELDSTACRGEGQKAGLTARRAEGIGEALHQGQAVSDVFVGCMAQHGYVQRPR